MIKHSHLLLDPDEIARLPTSGAAYAKLKAAADAFTPGDVKLADQDDSGDINLLALGLDILRTPSPARTAKVREGCMAAMGTESGARTLAIGRNLYPVMIAADCAGVRDRPFVEWARSLLRQNFDGKTLVSTHEKRPNNWGTHAGAARVAVDMFLYKYGTPEEKKDALEDAGVAAKVFHGWLGDRARYTGFDFGELDWQADEDHPVGINPKGSRKRIGDELENVDGVLPDDQRRAGGLAWPPPKENYVWEALQGAYVQAVLLSRVLGMQPFRWCDNALLRAVTWLHEECRFPAEGDDTWIPHLVNWAYGTTFPAPIPSSPGKGMGFTCWTHAGRRFSLPD